MLEALDPSNIATIISIPRWEQSEIRRNGKDSDYTIHSTLYYFRNVNGIPFFLVFTQSVFLVINLYVIRIRY